MMWVKLTLAWPVRSRYELIALRLTSSNFAGTFRKLVAVGTVRLFSMFSTIRAATPRIGVPSSLATPFSDEAAAVWGVGCGVAAGAGSEFVAGAAVVVADAIAVAVAVDSDVSVAECPLGR